MKKCCLFLFSLLLLMLCACAKKPIEAAPVQAEMPTQTTPDAQDAPEVTDEQPAHQKGGENGTQDEKQNATITPELLQKRLEHASLCSCLMEQGARWHLIQVGAFAETAEDAPFLSTLAAMEAELTAHPEKFAAVAEDTLWLLDSKPEGGLELQFLQAGLDNTVICRSLVFDGEGTRYQAEAELLESPYFSSCTEGAAEEERQQTLETCDCLSEDDLQPRFWRVSIATDSQLSLAAFSFSDAQATSFHAFPSGQPSGKLILNASDIVTEEPDELVLACLRMNLDECGVGEGDIMLLRGFLAMHLPDGGSFWDEPGPTDSDYSWFYDVRNALQLFLRDLRADETLAAEFLARESWVLIWDAGFEYTLIAQGTEDALAAHLYPAGIDVEGYQTPSRKNLERLALEGENSDLVPEEVRAQFVLAVMRDIQYGRMMSGEFGEAVWAWREVDGEIQLEINVMMADGTQIPLTARLVTTASGDLLLSVHTDAYTVADS